MGRGIVTITGGSGFVGQVLRPGLASEGYRVRVFDRLRGPLVDLLRRRHLGTASSLPAVRAARTIHRGQRRLEATLVRARVLRPTWDEILDVRGHLAERFAGSDAVVHLAGIAHPHAPGTSADDFRRINLDGAVNVFEAARQAGVPRFIFASSAQVYAINSPVRLDQFPILESNYCPGLEDGQTTYGLMKCEFERYLAENCATGDTQAVALRMEYPGFRSDTPDNLYVSTSIENLVAGFAAALNPPASFGFEAFNLADHEVDPQVVDVQDFLRTRWPHVPNHTTGNQCLMSTEKAQALLGYRPRSGGTYFDAGVVW
jgi:nucleoside-diphosphate-sugar epimerase